MSIRPLLAWIDKLEFHEFDLRDLPQQHICELFEEGDTLVRQFVAETRESLYLQMDEPMPDTVLTPNGALDIVLAGISNRDPHMLAKDAYIDLRHWLEEVQEEIER